MSADFHQDLHRELTEVGITGPLRARILTEFDDHLRSDPDADLGSPPMLARQFANQLGTSRARRAAFWAFGALVAAGLIVAAALLVSPNRAIAGAQVAGRPLAWVAAGVLALAAQVALAAGVLAGVRALRRRNRAVVTADEARVIVRRAAVGVGAGMLSMIALAAMALAMRRQPHWWTVLTVVMAAVGFLVLLGALPVLRSAVRVRPLEPGGAGDISEDLAGWAPASVQAYPWRVALFLAAVVLVGLTAVGIVTDDPYDGAVRGLVDGAASLVGFAVLGPYLGLWSPTPR
jgi:hypothetical protein